MAKISVLGSGAWGTALAMLLSDNGHEVLLWSPFAEHTEELRRTRKSSALGGLELPAGMQFTSDMKEAGRDCPCDRFGLYARCRARAAPLCEERAASRLCRKRH